MKWTDKLKSGATQFIFEWALEMNRDEIVAGFKKWMDLTPEAEWHRMIDGGVFPKLPGEYFQQASQYIEYIEKFSLQDLIEFLAEARPDLVMYINNCPTGGEYIVALREHMLNCIRESGQAPAMEIVTVTCDKCNKSFPAKKSEVEQIKKCPLCGAPSNA